jgi:hypothetical protein
MVVLAIISFIKLLRMIPPHYQTLKNQLSGRTSIYSLPDCSSSLPVNAWQPPSRSTKYLLSYQYYPLAISVASLLQSQVCIS